VNFVINTFPILKNIAKVQSKVVDYKLLQGYCS